MNLKQISAYLKEVDARIASMRRGNSASEQSPASWELTAAALDAAMEELRVAEEELIRQTSQMELSWQAAEIERRRYLDLFEFAPDGYLVTDLLGIIHEANRASAALLGDPPGFLEGKPLASYVDDDRRRTFRSELSRLPKLDRMVDWVVPLQPRKGLPFAAALTVQVVRDARGAPLALRWMARDFTARLEVEDQIRALKADLEQRVNAQSR